MPNDALERDADAGAEHVMRMAGPVAHGASASSAAARGGVPLSPDLRAFFEPRFGRDFSDVRIHADAAAADRARAAQARAYTIGPDVVFGAGEYAPATGEGRRLLAHELSHVVQQASAGTTSVQRQPVADDVATLERELASRISERAMLARMLEESNKTIDAGGPTRRLDTGAKKEEARLKSGAGVGLKRFDLTDLLPKVDVVREKGGYRLTARFELSYAGLTEEQGRSKAATDSPRLEKVLRDAWTVDLTEGRYAGNRFRLEPRIEFRPNTRAQSAKAFQLLIRAEAKGDTVADFARGEISFSAKDMEGDRVVRAGHELYHLFGFIVDSYYPQGGSTGPYRVGRSDPVRGDLLGMPDPQKLRDWRDRGLISQADFDRQTRATLKVWQEDATRILYALGAPLDGDKASPQLDPDSPDFDPQEALRAIERKGERRLDELRRDTDRDAEIVDNLKKTERAIQLDAEIAALQKKIAERKSGGTKPPAKP